MVSCQSIQMTVCSNGRAEPPVANDVLQVQHKPSWIILMTVNIINYSFSATVDLKVWSTDLLWYVAWSKCKQYTAETTVRHLIGVPSNSSLYQLLYCFTFVCLFPYFFFLCVINGCGRQPTTKVDTDQQIQNENYFQQVIQCSRSEA
jgi:hypothetical protein